ncbi:hypothetical protein SO802_005459 [Lithocarpus litseifolius]|uniref:Uncharacterized protein n=1 Tax=Lithocarpus litseifolius TaxID=425828 RepID=A0AAW2DMT5_9ROSI
MQLIHSHLEELVEVDLVGTMESSHLTHSARRRPLQEVSLLNFGFRFPPWNNHKLRLLASTFNYDYLGLVLVILGLKSYRQGLVDHPVSSSSHYSQNKITRNIRQNFSVAEPSNEQKHNEDTENDVEIIEGKVDLWTPLNCLVEAANRTKSSKSNSQGPSLAKSEQANAHDSEV